MCWEALISPIVGAVAGGLMQKKMAPKQPEASAPPPAPAPVVEPPKTQEAKAPSAFVDQNVRAAGAGPSSTMLTGAAGIDNTLLTLGRNTLLGA